MVELDRRHHLALGRERDFADALKPPLSPLGDAQLAFGHEKGGFGRVAVNLPFAARPLAQVGVAGQAAAAEHHDLLLAQRPGCQFSALVLDPSLGRITHPGDMGVARGGHHPLDGHFRAGQRAGLVRGNDRRRAQRLHRRKLLDDRVVLRHALHPQREHHRQDRRQPLGHRRHRQGHAEQQHVNDIGGVADIGYQQDGSDHHDSNDDNRDAQHAPDASDFFLQRCRLLGGGLEHFGDRTYFGIHAGCCHHGATGALRDGCALEYHVETVAKRCQFRQRGGILEHRFTLARQRGFLHPQRRGLNQACIRPDSVTLAEHEQVPTHQLGAGQPLYLTVTQDRRCRCGHPRQCGDGVLGLGFLQIAQNRVEQHNRPDDDGIHRPASHALDHPSDERDGNGGQQQVDQGIMEVRQEATPRGLPRGGAEFVGAVLRKPARRLL